MSPAAALRLVPSRAPVPSAPRRIPAWVRRIGAPVWVTGPDGRIVFVNERAQALLGASADACIGRPCHEVVASRTAAGTAFCRARCALVAAADAGREVEAADVCIGAAGGRSTHWVHLTVIPVDDPGGWGRSMVHTARVADGSRRIEEYVGRLARRSAALRASGGDHSPTPLSPREAEVLELLVQDVEPGRIAMRLGVSHATVRNHIQHLLAKLGAHSIEEAVAMHLLAST
jgi:DNA-binding CsgD family transcriptional regulator